MANIYGVDLSDVNAETFNAANFSDQVVFVGVKVSEGETYKDTKFIANINAIRAANKIPINYLFCNLRDDPQAQADEFFSRGIDWTKPGIWAIDVENSANDAWVQANQDLAQQNLRTLIELVKTGSNRSQGFIYTYSGFWRPTFGDPHSFTDCLLWDANYSTEIMQPFGGWASPTISQFSQFGNEQEAQPVVHGDIDWNIFEGTIDQLNLLAT
jgi:GH25 family lysozyme M1 (1,4-beta-N-acetylmuramidase)